MKSVIGKIAIILLGLAVFTGCDQDNLLGNLLGNSIEITDEQEMEMVANGITESTGGIMSAFQMAATVSDENFYTFGKVDTLFSRSWINFDIELSFFTADGSELPAFVPGMVDHITSISHMSGDTTFSYQNSSGSWQIGLNSHATLSVSDVTTTTLTVNGAATDSSHHVYSGNGPTIAIDSRSTLNISNVRLPMGGGHSYPISGTLSGAVAGTAASSGLTKDVHMPYTGEFIGNAEVLVTLTNSGRQFTVNLSTGTLTEN